jgi:hypothetical protein
MTWLARIRVPLAVLLCACASEPSSDEGDAGTNTSTTETGETGDPPLEFTCVVDRPFPYPSPMSYVGVHAGPANDDRVPCSLDGEWSEAWRALEGRGIAQPNTFSPDGRTTYVTTSEPAAGDCTIWALDTATGEQRFCLAMPGVLFSTLEVDLDGNLYTAADAAVLSWDREGNERWATEIPGDEPERNATGLHFTPAGHVATVTDAGLVMLLDRADGSVLAQLDIPATYGFVPLASLGLDLELEPLLPEAVNQDFARLFGPDGVGGVLGKFAGGSGDFSDNTVGIAPDGTLYVVGGGPDDMHGALVQIGVGGTADAPTLTAGWAVELQGGSASSPAISPDGQWVKISDGNSLANFLEPSNADATMHVIDIAACDANTDANPEPDRCVAAHAVPLLSGPALGASPVYDGAEAWRWEVQFGALFDQSQPDLVQTIGDQNGLSVTLPDDRVWSSVLTITNEHVIGTMTALTPSEAMLLTITLPSTAASEVVVVDRVSGELVFRAPITDDSSSTVTVGPDGGLYVTQLTLLHSLSVDTEAIGGLIKFAP